MMVGYKNKSLCVLLLLFVVDAPAEEVSVNPSVDETLSQIKRLPKDDKRGFQKTIFGGRLTEKTCFGILKTSIKFFQH